MKKTLAILLILTILSGCTNKTNGSENSSLINQESSRDSFLPSSIQSEVSSISEIEASSAQVNSENIHSFPSKKIYETNETSNIKMVFLDEETLGISYIYQNQDESQETYSHVEIALDVKTKRETPIKFSELKNPCISENGKFQIVTDTTTGIATVIDLQTNNVLAQSPYYKITDDSIPADYNYTYIYPQGFLGNDLAIYSTWIMGPIPCAIESGVWVLRVSDGSTTFFPMVDPEV